MARLGALIFDGFELLDLFGPLEMFALLENSYEISLIAETAGPVAGNKGVRTIADYGIADAPDLDLLLIPGGRGTRTQVDNPALLDWIAATTTTTDIIMSVCTGSALLARAGVLDGCRATTNKSAFHWVTTQGPKVDWQPQARWVADHSTGKPVFTSSGVSAGMDMALAVIQHIHGEAKADQVAHWCEYRRAKNADDDPFAKANGLV